MLTKLLVFDLETTSTDTEQARIVELAYEMVDRIGTVIDRDRWLINPEIPIPEQATDVHGITDSDVKYAPTLKELANQIHALFCQPGITLCGFNNWSYDNVVLEKEMARVGMPITISDLPCFDVYQVHLRLFPRTLSGVVQQVLGEDVEDAHSAVADTRYTRRVARKLMSDFTDQLPDSPEQLNGFLFPNHVDRDGKLQWNSEGEAEFTFGKLKGMTLADAVVMNSGYVEWICSAGFPEDLKQICRKALAGEFPSKSSEPINS